MANKSTTSPEVERNRSPPPHVPTNTPTVYLWLKRSDKQASASRAAESKAAQVGQIGGWHTAGSGQAAALLRMNKDKLKSKAPAQLSKTSRDFDETTSFWARVLVLVQCSLAGVWMACLILCQRIQGPAGTWDAFGGLFLSRQQLFWNDADVNNYGAKRSWRGGNRGGLAGFHLQSFGINWLTSKSRDAF